MIPVWLMLLCSVVMALGTSVGGEKIIKSVGMDMVKLERYQGFSADLARRPLPALFQPVRYPRIHHPYENQRHHGRGGAVKRISAINFGVVKEMVLTWVFTFPAAASSVCDGKAVYVYFLTPGPHIKRVQTDKGRPSARCHRMLILQ